MGRKTGLSSLARFTGGLFLIALFFQNGFSQNGVWVEAETVNAVSPWKLQTSVPGFWGTGYFFCDMNSDLGGNNGGKAGVLSYEVNIPKDGLYEVAIRGLRTNQGVCVTHDQCNDIYIKVGSQPWVKKMVKMNTEDVTDSLKWGGRWNEWVYDATWGDVKLEERPNFNLKQGKLNFQISARSQKVHLDGFAFYIQNTTPPIPNGVTSVGKNPFSANSLTTVNKIDVFTLNGVFVKTIAKTTISEVRKQLDVGMYVFKIQENGITTTRSLQIITK